MYSKVADDTSRKDIRILVVEDVDFNRKILADILAERGWKSVTATSGEEALALLAHDTDFQVILMDIGLPGIDGMETTRKIKENPATLAIPVIALTAETTAEQERLLAAGLDGYAEKNFDPEQLFTAVEKHLIPAGANRQEAVDALANPAEHPDLDFAALLATYADEAILRRIALAFFADANKELHLLGEAMSAGDQAAILACCHSLRGSSTIFTAKKLALAAKELEECVRQGNKNETESAWNKVLTAHDSLRGAVKSRLGLAV